MIEVWSPGTEVKMDGEIPAKIRGITIHSEHWIKYLCVWWEERTRKEEWLHEDEFAVQNGSRKIGVTFVETPNTR